MEIRKDILLIGRTDSKSACLLKQEATTRELVFDMVTPAQVIVTGDQVCFAEGVDIDRPFFSYDTYFFRGLGKRAEELQVVASVLEKQHNKRVIERCFAMSGLPEDKIVSPSVLGTYTVPESRIVDQSIPHDLFDQLLFPLVAKRLGAGSSMGRWVRKIKTPEELQEFISLDPEASFLLQEYFQIEYDLRVMVVGDRALGGFRRYKREGEDFLTSARGGRREEFFVTPDIAAAALEATKLQGLEIAGVDLITHNGKIYIIEVNASPQFIAFEQMTNINAAGAILDHLLFS